ncbi:MAG: metal-dependent hydrolase [Hyphomicrobiaceae bacterium]|nr:metal-dependent hydrolase [Hyphomicrobiaceae bacterium]
MDPLTQGAVGAALPQATRNDIQVGIAGLLGFAAGMAADVDVFIRSDTDPLLFLEYHRQFTHSLIFIPLGGLLCALVLHVTLGRRWRLTFARTFLFCTLGYATHPLLDTFTSYGTILLWPFSDERFSWNIISIVDPLFTVPILALVILAGLRQKPVLARIALAWAALYLTLGFFQHNSAVAMGREIAASRGHEPIRLEVKPSFGNMLVWKTIYETSDRFYVDAVRAGVLPRVFAGVSVPKLDVSRDLTWLDPASQQARDVERFRWFSKGFVALDPDHPNHVIDVRYSFVPNTVSALWSIELAPEAPPAAHARYRTHREHARESLGKLWQLILGDISDRATRK